MFRNTLISGLLSQAQLAFRLLREPRVPIAAKVVPALTGLYVISPVDLLPDVIPVIGQIDDLLLIAVAVRLFIGLCPPAARLFHEHALAARRQYTPMPASEDFIDVTPR